MYFYWCNFLRESTTERLAVRLLFGLILIVLSLLEMVPNTKSDNIKEPEKFNFRQTDNNNNCGECSRFNKKSSDESDVNCKFFHIKTDENHKMRFIKTTIGK